ncbi:3'-5' exonuclease [Stutzerimonas chloritidismutans]
MVSEARDYPSLHPWVSTVFEKHVVAGFNSRAFDVGVLQACMARYSLPICEPELQLDVRDIWIEVSGSQRGNLSAVAKAYEVTPGTAHRADGDAITAARILEAMLWQHGVERVMDQLVQRAPAPADDLVATP